MSCIRGYDAWMRVLTDQDLLTLNSVVKDICDLSSQDQCRADELTQIILRDANLTSKVLKIANSVHYNHSLMPIKTVSRGIVLLGLNNLKNIALASCLVDSLINGKYKTMIIACLAKSFHAAVQARALVPLLNYELKEQVFIAALLHNVGELALLATENAAAEAFITERNFFPERETAIGMTHLGTDIQLINKGIIQSWSLMDLVFPAGSGSDHPNAINAAIQLGLEISKYIHKGLSSPEMQKIYVQVAAINRISPSAAKAQVKKMAEEASAIAKCYGVSAPDIIEPETAVETTIAADALLTETKNSQSTTAVQAATGYEFQQYVNKMLALIMNGDGVAKVMQIGINALHEGAGIDRVCIAMIDYRYKCAEFRYTAGKGTQVWTQTIRIQLDKLSKDELLNEFLQLQEFIWFKVDNKNKESLGVLGKLIDKGDLMLAPLKLDKRILAFIYADAAEQHLTHRQFEEFQIISNQLNLMLKINSGTR
jgi:hypothetical protein